MNLLESVSDQLNLRWAWEKVRRAATPGDAWVDEVELAEFELGLGKNLQGIADELRRGRYRMSQIRPMAFPKNHDKDNKPQLRQYFKIAIRDQVAWTAFVNVVGPQLDIQMPGWSYGNRLYRSIWIEKDAVGKRHRKIGRYRHSSGWIYLHFGQSWPIFRRHVYLTTRAMTNIPNPPELDDATEEELELIEAIGEKGQPYCEYVRKDYWQNVGDSSGKGELFWCSLDLRKFYPSMKLEVVRRNIVDYLPDELKKDADRLLSSMLRFLVDTRGWTEQSLSKIGLSGKVRTFRHVPTGLYVAGFLANVGLLRVDKEVEKLLKDRTVAHFRFVDDHIVLAHSINDLLQWVRKYLEILRTSNTGARVNIEKTEPVALGQLLSRMHAKMSGRQIARARDAAEEACRLDVKFPSPLMTKTLALVSAIARTNFDLLEESELEALGDQLEQLLLAEIPEAEIPERTRLAFAATRLVRLAECRLANDTRLAELKCEHLECQTKSNSKELTIEQRHVLLDRAKKVGDEIAVRNEALAGQMKRAFDLLIKVLRDRPDRIRLWSRAILMCRQTGVKGMSDLFSEIDRIRKEESNPLAADYLLANTLSLIGSQVMVAAKTIVGGETAEWRKRAASLFLRDVCAHPCGEERLDGSGWFVRSSWQQYCFGLYCASLIVRDHRSANITLDFEFPSELLSSGSGVLNDNRVNHNAASWGWWAARMSLRKLSPFADSMTKLIGSQLERDQQALTFWRSFPTDVPNDFIDNIDRHGITMDEWRNWEGWWYDVLLGRDESTRETLLSGKSQVPSRVRRNVAYFRQQNWISMYEWCRELKIIAKRDSSDPRFTEWTSLEIVRQIALSLMGRRVFDGKYLTGAHKRSQLLPHLHPANFRLPQAWIKPKTLTWPEWKSLVAANVKKPNRLLVPEANRLIDERYTPIYEKNSRLFFSMNPVRGLGLLLYGLLRKDFTLPAMWNGSGQSDLLTLLPKLLLNEMTCSSWTLGVLLSCLQPRAMENIVQWQLSPDYDLFTDDDTLNDPLKLLSASDVIIAVEKCQAILTENQLSTLNHRARQLTPMSIRQLTQPNWSRDFLVVSDGGEEDAQT